MKQALLILLFTIPLNTPLFSQTAPAIEWAKCYGGSKDDGPNAILQTNDGGYIMAGRTQSKNSGDVTINKSLKSGNFWIVKTDGKGKLIWQKTYGGSVEEGATAIQQTTDGGYIIVGYSGSKDGDVLKNNGFADVWILKIDQIGTIEWQKSYGGTDSETASSVQQTTDGGYIVAGSALSRDGDVVGHHGVWNFIDDDIWVLKLDYLGNLEWSRCLGGDNDEGAYAIIQTTDGGFLMAGTTGSNNGDVHGNKGMGNGWLVKLNYEGNIEWQHCYGGSQLDYFSSVQQTSDNGFIVVGTASSFDGDVTGHHSGSGYDVWALKVDGFGNIEWQKCLGGTGEDIGNSVWLTYEGDYIIAAHTQSNDGDVKGNHGGIDYWVVKLSKTGNIIWQECLGGKGNEINSVLQQTREGGYVITGWAGFNSGQVIGAHGKFDYWIVKLKADINATKILDEPTKGLLIIFPNPSRAYVAIETKNMQEVRIIDMIGKEYFRHQIPKNNQLYYTYYNIQFLARGKYIVQARGIDGVLKTGTLLVE